MNQQSEYDANHWLQSFFEFSRSDTAFSDYWISFDYIVVMFDCYKKVLYLHILHTRATTPYPYSS